MRFQVSLQQLAGFAHSFWEMAGEARVFAFHGQMGAGKTTIITAICRARGVKDPIASPTFSIINEYEFNEAGSDKTIYHIDLYRLKDEEEVIRAGVEDCIYSDSICLVEWPEKAPHLFDDQTVDVYIEATSENERRIDIRLPASYQAHFKEQS